MKVTLLSRYRGRFKEQPLDLKAGEHDLEPALILFLKHDSPGLFVVEDVKDVVAPPVDKMQRRGGLTTKNTFQRG